jgi:uncharacterized protein (TIGR02001 family)
MSITKYASLGAASLLAAAVFAGPALADGMPSRGKVRGEEPPLRGPCTFSANVGLTTDYVFRGTSQSAEDPAVQGGVDATCGMFYAGVWASSIEFGSDASTEIDLYAGLKKSYGRFNFDVGLLYYLYAGSSPLIVLGQAGDLDFVEIKAGVSTEVWKGGTIGATVFFSPDYQLETGEVWTVEGSFSQALPNVGMFSPTFSALIGYQTGDDPRWQAAFANGDDSFVYWNAGVTLGFLEKWSLDLRYWDTDISNGGGFCTGQVLQCDSRFLATVKYTY